MEILESLFLTPTYFRRCDYLSISLILTLTVCLVTSSENEKGGGVHNFVHELKYVWGDAFSDRNALGADGQPYPWEEAAKVAKSQPRLARAIISNDDDDTPGGRSLLTPEETRKALLSAFESHEFSYEISSFTSPQRKARSNNNNNEGQSRTGSSSTTTTTSTTTVKPPPSSEGGGCVPTRLCETSYNTTAPLYGISLTSGKPVTIVQKFPDLLQQVVYQVCKSEECDVIQGRCVQTYLPYLFLVIPLGPVTLTGQDYVLVESGCACRPKYAKKSDQSSQIPHFIQNFQQTSSSNNANNNASSSSASSSVSPSQRPRTNKLIF